MRGLHDKVHNQPEKLLMRRVVDGDDECHSGHIAQELKSIHMQETRYVMKYRHCDGKLVMKVTNDRVCLKYKTDQAQDAKKMEKLNNIFFIMMAHGPDVDVTEVLQREAAAAQATQPAKKGRGRRQ